MSEAARTEKAPKKSFFKGLKAEFNKIIWPDPESAGKRTVAVIACSVALGVVIAVLDLMIQFGLSFIL